MGQIKVTKCDIDGLCVIEPTVHGDARGYKNNLSSSSVKYL